MWIFLTIAFAALAGYFGWVYLDAKSDLEALKISYRDASVALNNRQADLEDCQDQLKAAEARGGKDTDADAVPPVVGGE